MSNTQRTVMVVDDDKPIRTLLKRILEPAGYRVILAENGTEALSLLDKNKPDLIMLDILMPKMDGFQTLDAIRHLSDVPVIMLTAIDDAVAVGGALGLGADDYIRKPFRTSELLARIKAKLRRAEADNGRSTATSAC